MKIAIFGGSGQVGTILSRFFHAKADDVIVLSRNPWAAPWRTAVWDAVRPGAWVHEVADAEVWINLAGRSVNCRYTDENRQAIYDSRIGATQLLNWVIESLGHPPRVWLNASTATIYRHALDRAMDEATGELGGGEADAPDTWNFSIDVAMDWENAFFSTETPQTRKVALRSAMTMSPDPGGVFDELSKLVRRGLGGTLGPGTQFVSWIHELDFARAVEFLIRREDLEGPVNVAAPCPLPMRDFLRALREQWGVRIGLPTPAWLLEIGAFLMRTESELVLKSRRVVPGRLLSAGFDFRFPEWRDAAAELVLRAKRLR